MSYSSESSVAMSYSSENSFTSFEEAQKEIQQALKAMQETWGHERSKNESLKKEFERLKSENIRLEDELRKCRISRDECLVDETYDILMERVRRGGGETSLKEIFDELRRRNAELEGEKRELECQLRVLGKKYKDLDQRVLQLERDISM